ncbi:MAG: hypothetical protein Q9179_006414 [Wetmoreana sp. 5 TL-2023]
MTTTLVPATITTMSSNGVVKTVVDREQTETNMRPEAKTDQSTSIGDRFDSYRPACPTFSTQEPSSRVDQSHQTSKAVQNSQRMKYEKTFDVAQGQITTKKPEKNMHQIKASDAVISQWLGAQLRELYPGCRVRWCIPYHISRDHSKILKLPLALAQDVKDRLVGQPSDLMRAVIPKHVLFSYWQEHGYYTVPEWKLFFPETVEATKESKGSELPPRPPQEVEKAKPQLTSTAAVNTDVFPMEDSPLQGLEDDFLDIEGPDESLFIGDDSASVSAGPASLKDTGLKTTIADPVFDKETSKVLPCLTGTSSDPVKIDEEVSLIENSSQR